MILPVKGSRLVASISKAIGIPSSRARNFFMLSAKASVDDMNVTGGCSIYVAPCLIKYLNFPVPP